MRRRDAATVRAIAGFTLVELMITVAVVAILAAVVLPSYQDSVRKARRTDARGALTTVAQLMERYNTEKNTYATATLGSAALNTNGTVPYQYRDRSENGYYTLALSNLGVSTFTITATAGGSQVSDPCSSFTLDQTGLRGVSGGSLTAAQCW